MRMNGKSIMEVALEAAYDANMDKATLRRIEALALPEIKSMEPEEIRLLRESEKLSRGIWARLLNVKPTTVQKWEAGTTSPDGTSLKLLNMVKKNGVSVLLQ